jgi:hypothetical protein
MDLLETHMMPIPQIEEDGKKKEYSTVPNCIFTRSCIVHSAFRIVYMSGSLDWTAFKVNFFASPLCSSPV